MRQVIEVPGFTHHDLPYNLIVNLQHTRSPRRQTHAEPPEKLSYHAVWTGNGVAFHADSIVYIYNVPCQTQQTPHRPDTTAKQKAERGRFELP